MMKIGVSCQKGGVSKTTNTANIAGAAAAKGYDVLAVDADPQGYLTQNLGFRDAYIDQDERCFYDAWMEPKEVDVNDIIVEHAEFDLLPANARMFTLQKDLLAEGYQLGKRLTQIFDGISGYDLIIVDAPPALNMINDNVLIATENLIIPVEAKETSTIALETLLSQISTLEDRYEMSITELACIVSDVNYPLNAEQEDMIQFFQRMFEGACPVYEIRNRAVFQRAEINNRSIIGYEEECDQEDTYMQIVENLEIDS